MTDHSIKKIDADYSEVGPEGQRYLVSGARVAMRLWQTEPKDDGTVERVRSYETVGYVIHGRAKVTIGDSTIELSPGDSWLVPALTKHYYTIVEPFTAVEATAPPAREDHQDDTP